MPLETVRVTVQTDDTVPALVDDVVVRVYDATGTTLQTFGTTGGVNPGEVEFTLDGDAVPVEYQLRFYLLGGSIVSPQQISVYSPPTPANNFAITAHVPTLPEAATTDRCRVSGYVIRPDGSPMRGCDIHLIHRYYPIISSDRIVTGERISHKTNQAGYVEFDLLRRGLYIATVEGYTDVPREVEVPNAPAVRLSDLLFPIPVSIAWDAGGPWTVAEGNELVLTPVVTLSSGVTVQGPAAEDLEYTVSDPLVASVSFTETELVVHGNAAGTTTLQISRRDTSIGVLPDPGISAGSLGITVT
jgi:hypothetical protein